MKEQIKHWLKSHGRDREWLGQQLDTEVKTVHNWLSSARAIPAAKLALITRLMADDEAADARRKQQYDPVAQVFSLETDLATFRAYSQAAKHHQLTLEEWCISELNTAADQWFVDGKPTIHHTRQAQASDSTFNECDAEQPFTAFELDLIAKAQAMVQAQAQAQAESQAQSHAGDNPADSPRTNGAQPHTQSTGPQ
jgi:hypothetical protein